MLCIFAPMGENKKGSITSHGYKIIYVGKNHHLSNANGYAYEHRLIAEIKIGRPLEPNEHVHHIDEIKLNNSPDNLEVVNLSEHRFRHRKIEKGLKKPSEPNIEIECHCGCGKRFLKYDSDNRPRHYISGHNKEISKLSDTILIYIKEEISFGDLLKKVGGSKVNLHKLLKRLVIEGKAIQIDRGIYCSTGTKKTYDEIIKCACGCGESMKKYDNSKRERKYISGHNMKSKPITDDFINKKIQELNEQINQL